MRTRLPLMVLGAVGLLFTAGCQVLAGCSKPDAYAGAQQLPKLTIPAGLDGPDTTEALEIPALTQAPEGSLPEDSCLEDPPPMREPGSNTLNLLEAPAEQPNPEEPKPERRSTTRGGPHR
jgi:uncharacterized lipoprotein